MTRLILVFLLLALPAHAENCIALGLKTAKYSVTKTQRVATAWKAGRHSMREEAARATVTKRRFQHARRIMKIIV